MFAEPEHLLLGLLSNPGTPAAELLHRHGLALDAARARVDAIRVMPTGEGALKGSDIAFSPALQAVTTAAGASSAGGAVGTAHLLCSLLRQQPAGKGLQKALEGVNVEDLLTQAEQQLEGGTEEPTADPPSSGEAQAERLRQLYQQHLEQQRARGPSDSSGFGIGAARQPTQQELDDIYE